MDLFSELHEGRLAQAKVIELQGEIGLWQARTYSLMEQANRQGLAVTAPEVDEWAAAFAYAIVDLRSRLEQAEAELAQAKEQLQVANGRLASLWAENVNLKNAKEKAEALAAQALGKNLVSGAIYLPITRADDQ